MPQTIARRRVHVRRVPRRVPVPPPAVPAEQGPATTALYPTVLAWLLAVLPRAAFHRPTLKRLAVLISGLLAGDTATASSMAAAVQRLQISAATQPSIQRRIARLEADAHLAPERVLPALFRRLLPTLLAPVLASHAANDPSGPRHHAHFVGVRLVVDGSSKGDQVQVLTLGLAYQGLVLPLLVCPLEQNAPLPPGEYHAQVMALLSEANRLLPGPLRPHVLVLADRLYGTPAMLDLLASLGWHWVLRVQGQTRVRDAQGREHPIARLAPAPGRSWTHASEVPPDPAAPVAAFKKAGWRPCRVVATWLEGQDEPWLLLTDLPARPARVADYAHRWAIERLFLSWKSHGFDLEAAGIADPARLGVLLTGLVLATAWRLAAAIPVAAGQLSDLARRAPLPRQLPLPGFARATPPIPPWPAKFSLFTWGAWQFHAIDPRWGTPQLCWEFPLWDAPPWSQRCREMYYGTP